MYEKIRATFIGRDFERIAVFKNTLLQMTAKQTLEDDFFSQFTTSLTERLLKEAGDEAVPDKVIQKMCAEYRRSVRYENIRLTRALDKAEDTEVVDAFDVKIRWHKTIRGLENPTCIVYAHGHRTQTFKDVEDGYFTTGNMLSTALNRNPYIMKLMYDWADKGGEMTRAVRFDGNLYPLPFFTTGCSVSEVLSVFKLMGFEYTHHLKEGGIIEILEFRRESK